MPPDLSSKSGQKPLFSKLPNRRFRSNRVFFFFWRKSRAALFFILRLIIL